MRSERTFGWIFATASVVPALAGLVASTMLAVDYLRPMPVFCQEGSGCDALRHTSYAGLFGVPTPLFGVVGFLAIGIVALIGGRRARLAQLALALGAALVGVLLVLIQARIGQLCPYCMVADTSAMLSAVIASARPRRRGAGPGRPPRRLRVPWSWRAPGCSSSRSSSRRRPECG
jgi:uncharacterized membrane protein